MLEWLVGDTVVGWRYSKLRHQGAGAFVAI